MADEEIRKQNEERRAVHMAQLKKESRLGIPFGVRMPLATTASFMAGMALGLTHGSQVTGLRFRAENAHRLPTTPTGWYLYHKSKNYQMAFGGVKEGIKLGSKLSILVAGLLSLENMLDTHRGTKDLFNTVIASLSIAGGFSLWNRFPITTAARTARTGLMFGLGYGLLQDGLGIARGRRPGYVEFILRKLRRKGEPDSNRMT